jgi:hypothetical protein
MNQNRSLKNYIQYGKTFVQAKVNKIIFIDEDLYEDFQTYLSNSYTIFIPYKKKDMYFYEYDKNNQIDQFSLNTKTPEKDTKEYMFTMCHKTEFIRQAIEKNPFHLKNDQYVWVDFGINHVCKMDEQQFSSELLRCDMKKYDKVRIASIWDLNVIYSADVYKDVLWYFAGGVFGGNKNYLLKFADLVKNKIIEIISEKHSIMWEVNIWWLVYHSQNSQNDLFDPYKASHDVSIINNY